MLCGALKFTFTTQSLTVTTIAAVTHLRRDLQPHGIPCAHARRSRVRARAFATVVFPDVLEGGAQIL